MHNDNVTELDDNCLGNQEKNCEIKITGKLFIVERDDSLAYLYLTHIIVGKNTVKGI